MYQQNIPFDPSVINSIKIFNFSSQCLESAEMGSADVDEVFDAMNCSKCVGSVASYSTVKRANIKYSINTKYTRIRYKILNTRIHQLSCGNTCN